MSSETEKIIVDASGNVVGSVTLGVDDDGHHWTAVTAETPELAAALQDTLAGRGLQVEDPPVEETHLDFSGDLENVECKVPGEAAADVPGEASAEPDPCTVAASVNYAAAAARDLGIQAPMLAEIIATKHLGDSEHARQAMTEFVEAAGAASLTSQELDEVRAYVRFAYPDLAQRLPG